MTTRIVAALLAIAGLQPSTALAVGMFTISTQDAGVHRYAVADTLCVDFPAGTTAMPQSRTLHDGNLHIARVDYADRLAFVVTSTLPDGRDAAAEQALQWEQARASQAALPRNLQASRIDGPFGPVVALHMRDVAQDGRSGPFPLERDFYDNPGPHPLTIAASRLFVRGADRFEVAILAGPGGDTPEAVDRRHVQVDAWADALLASLQRCTAAIPVRTND